MKNLPKTFYLSFYQNLLVQYSNTTIAIEKLEGLKIMFKELALALFPALPPKQSIKQLSAQSKQLSLCYGYFLAVDKATHIGLIGQDKSFSYHNLDALCVLRIISEFVEEISDLTIPHEIELITERLGANYNLSQSKTRLDALLANEIIRQSKKTIKKIKLAFI